MELIIEPIEEESVGEIQSFFQKHQIALVTTPKGEINIMLL